MQKTEHLAEAVSGYGANVMLAYGGGSIKKNGIYDEVKKILEDAGKNVFDFSGIMSNPTYAKVQEGAEPPTYACVGTSDGIASFRSMEDYIGRIKDNGTDAEIEVFDGLRHGFGLGEGTVAEGWIDHAVSFWERNMNN